MKYSQNNQEGIEMKNWGWDWFLVSNCYKKQTKRRILEEINVFSDPCISSPSENIRLVTSSPYGWAHTQLSGGTVCLVSDGSVNVTQQLWHRTHRSVVWSCCHMYVHTKPHVCTLVQSYALNFSGRLNEIKKSCGIWDKNIILQNLCAIFNSFSMYIVRKSFYEMFMGFFFQIFHIILKVWSKM